MANKKVLILTASPLRDASVDEMLARELKKRGCDVWVRPCLREGRQSVLDLEPEIVVLPPIRNPHSRDLAETLKYWGVAVVSRHTEASADWDDFKNMSQEDKKSILGAWTYNIDLELTWGEDEAQILSRRNCGFPIVAVGSFDADKYQDADTLAKAIPKGVLYKKHNLNLKKRTILILSAWGFLDSGPDLRIDEYDECRKDEQGRDRWLKMIRLLHKKLKDKFNFLVTVHPNVMVEPYQTFLDKLNIPLDAELKCVDLVKSCDVVIHAGSTTAMGAHFLGKPAFQYGDQNQSGGWFDRAESALSHISPYAKSVQKLTDYIESCKFDESNASVDALKNLENGRYGKMDGRAAERSAELISRRRGHFRMRWPMARHDYDQIGLMKNVNKILVMRPCGICHNIFYMVKDEWLNLLFKALNLTEEQQNRRICLDNSSCPYCAAKFYKDENSGNNTGPTEQQATSK